MLLISAPAVGVRILFSFTLSSRSLADDLDSFDRFRFSS